MESDVQAPRHAVVRGEMGGWGVEGCALPSCAASRERLVIGQGSPLCNGTELVESQGRGEDVY